MYSFAHQSLAANRSYLCAYGSFDNSPFLHLMDKATGTITELNNKVTNHLWQHSHFFTNNDEICILGHGEVSVNEFPIRKIESFGFGAPRDHAITSNAVLNVYGHSEVNNTFIAHQFVEGTGKNNVFQYGLDDLQFRNVSVIPHRKPPEMYDQNLTTEEKPQQIAANQFGEFAILIRGWVSDTYFPMYSRIEIFGEESPVLRHKQTLYVAHEADFHFPCGLAVDFDGSFLVLTDSFNYTEPDRVSVHRCKRSSSDEWSLEFMNKLVMPDQQFSSGDIFAAGGHIFVAGVTDRGVRKPLPSHPKVNYERYPFIHSFRRSDGQETGLARKNFHSDPDEEWQTARAFVDTEFIYIHGFIQGKAHLKRFQHDGSPMPY